MNLKELTERYELFPAELQNSLLGQQIKTQIKKMQTLAPGQIAWFQGSKLDGFKPDNPLNQLYGIHGIPHIVLLNTDNQIVVTTTDIKILREEILKLFKQ